MRGRWRFVARAFVFDKVVECVRYLLPTPEYVGDLVLELVSRKATGRPWRISIGSRTISRMGGAWCG